MLDILLEGMSEKDSISSDVYGQKFLKNLDQKKPQILVVDDDRYFTDLLAKVLEKESEFSVHICSNPVSALEKFSHVNPDLVILDIMLPDVDGIEVAAYLSKMSSVVPILFISSDGSYRERIEGLQLDQRYAGFIEKPIDCKEIKTIVCRFLNERL